MATDIPFSAAFLEALGEPVAVAQPVAVEGEIIDLEVVWMSSALKERARAANVTSARMSEIYADLYESGWLEELVIARATGRRSTRFRRTRRADGTLDVAELSGKWVGDWLIATVRDLNTQAASNADIVRAAAMVTELIASNPVFARLLLPNQTLEFATRAWVEARGGTDTSFEQMIPAEERPRVDAWLAQPPSQRDDALSFRAHNGLGGLHWYSIRSEFISDTGLEVQLVSDIDHYVRSQRASERLARDLHGQLDVLTRALDAAREGFAIWRAVRDESGEIETFVLEFMNLAGAAPTGTPPDVLVNRSLETVLGHGQAAGLKALFTVAVERDETLSGAVEVNSPAGWRGKFENHIAPIGNDCVVASFRPIGEAEVAPIAPVPKPGRRK